MEFTLVNGGYTANEAEQLLSKLFKVKTDFHIAKIDTLNLFEEDIKHSEKRVKELEDEMRKINKLLKEGHYKRVAIHTNISVDFFPSKQN